MSKFIIFILLFFFANVVQSQSVKFYSDTISFANNSRELPLYIYKKDEKKDVLSYYKILNDKGVLKHVSSQLQQIKEKYKINDFFMGGILESYCFELAPKNLIQQRVFMYCVLIYMGYDIKLAHSNNTLVVLAYTDSELSNRSYLRVNGKKYFHIQKSSQGILTSCFDAVKNSGGVIYTFKITSPPLFNKQEYLNKQVFFYENKRVLYDDSSPVYLRGKIKEIKTDTSIITLSFNKTIIELYKDNPVNNYSSYFSVGISDTLNTQILSFIQKKITSKSIEDSLKYIINFCRSKGKYLSDKEAYGKGNRPMFPEEALYYEYSDCEDRNSLLFYLIKEILHLPMIILEYPEHINIAVNIEGDYKQLVKYKGRNYYVCEASTGSSEVLIGDSYSFKKYSTPKIIGEWGNVSQ